MLFMGKLTISIIFNSYVSHNQRVSLSFDGEITKSPWKSPGFLCSMAFSIQFSPHPPWRPSVIDRGGQLSRRANAAHHVGHGVGPAEGQPGPGDGGQDAQGTPQVAEIW